MSTRTISAAEARILMARDIREIPFQNQLVKEAKEAGWLVQHSRPAYSKSGRVSTPIQGHKGFPDLVLVKAGRPVIFAELKKVGAYPFCDQRMWRDALLAAGAMWYCWRPTDWDQIREVLAS